jgi:RNA-binding protein
MTVTKRPGTLDGKQRRQLKALAHGLDPIVQVGGGGITPAILAAIDQALTDHELIKIRLGESCPVPRKEAGPLLSDPVGAHDIGLIGRIVIVYRRHPTDPVIPLRT